MTRAPPLDAAATQITKAFPSPASASSTRPCRAASPRRPLNRDKSICCKRRVESSASRSPRGIIQMEGWLLGCAGCAGHRRDLVASWGLVRWAIRKGGEGLSTRGGRGSRRRGLTTGSDRGGEKGYRHKQPNVAQKSSFPKESFGVPCYGSFEFSTANTFRSLPPPGASSRPTLRAP